MSGLGRVRRILPSATGWSLSGFNLLQRVYQRSSLGQGLLCLAQGHMSSAVPWWPVRGWPDAVVCMLSAGDRQLGAGLTR